MKTQPLCFLPASCRTLAFALDTKGLDWDLNALCLAWSQSVTLRGKCSRPQIYSRKLKRDSWMQRLAGATLQPFLTESFTRSWVQQILSAHSVSPASPIASPEKERALMTSGGFLIPLQMDLLSCDPGMSSSRTSLGCSPAGCQTNSSASTTSSPDWRASDTKWWIVKETLSSEYSARLRLALHTKENESSSSDGWPTPSASNPNDGESKETWEARAMKLKEKHGNGNGAGTPLAIAVQQWPTPAQSTAKQGENEPDGRRGQTLVGAARGQDWATPRSSPNENRQTKLTPSQMKGEHGLSLAAQAAYGTTNVEWKTPRTVTGDYTRDPSGKERPSLEGQAKIDPAWGLPYRTDGQPDPDSPSTNGNRPGPCQLNPDWVETLMNVPVGWTEI